MQYKNKLVEGNTEKVRDTIENNVILKIVYCFELAEIVKDIFVNLHKNFSSNLPSITP